MADPSEVIGKHRGLGRLIAGIAIGATLCFAALRMAYWSGAESPPPAAGEWTACFNGPDMALLAASPVVRFYAAAPDKQVLSALAVAVDLNHRHVPDAAGRESFLLFEEVANGRARTRTMDAGQAESAAKQVMDLGQQPWSVDIPSELVPVLLAVKGANGLGLRAKLLTSGHWTFEVAPVKLSGRTATLVGGPGDVRVVALPCPANCPGDRAFYLHLR